MARTVLGIFSERDSANSAIGDLEEKGHSPRDISIIMKQPKEVVTDSTGAHVASGIVSGATTVGLAGAIAAILTATGVITIPGFGALLIGGPLASALGLTGTAATAVSAAATGVVAGGLFGALVGLGIPSEEARYYEQRIQEGGILVAVPANLETEDEVKDILEKYGADKIRSVSLERSRKETEHEHGYRHA